MSRSLFLKIIASQVGMGKHLHLGLLEGGRWNAYLHPAEENEVDEVVLAADFEQHLVLVQVDDTTRHKHLLECLYLQLHKNGVLLVQYDVGDVN